MNPSCRFLSDEFLLEEHKVRILEINCDNGYSDNIYVTSEPAFSKKGLNVWHYETNGKTITLTGVGNNSVDFTAVNPKANCHVTITEWPLLD